MQKLILLLVFTGLALPYLHRGLAAPCPSASMHHAQDSSLMHIQLSDGELCVPVITPLDRQQMQQQARQRRHEERQQLLAEQQALMQWQIEKIELEATMKQIELLDQQLAWLGDRKLQGYDIEDIAWKVLSDLGASESARQKHGALAELWQRYHQTIRHGQPP